MGLNNVFHKAGHLIKKFPVPIIFCLLFCIGMMRHWRGHQNYPGFLSLSWCGCFLFISLKLYAQAHHLKWWQYYILSFAGLGIVWYFFDFSNVFLAIGLFLSIFIAPFLFKKDLNHSFWQFGYHLWGQIFLTILVSAGIFICVLSIRYLLTFLLDIQFYNGFELDIFIVIATLFSPIIYMYGIPEVEYLKYKSCPKILSLFMTYVVFPFLFIYGLILHLYIAKIIILWSLPKGQVCYLVGGFGVLMVISYLIVYPIRYANKLFAFCNHHIFKILLLPLVLMLLGIGIRIAEFGMTETRYFVVLLLIWLILSSYFTLNKKNQEVPKFIVATFVILLIGGAFGPWGAAELSGYSQLQRLEFILKNKHVELDKLSSYPWELTNQDEDNIGKILEYFINTGKVKQLKQQSGFLRAIEKLPQTDAIREKDRKEKFENLAKRWNDLLKQSESVNKGDLKR